MARQYVSTDISQLPQDLLDMEKSLPAGGECLIQLCTEFVPDQSDLDQFYTDMVEEGFHVSKPVVSMIGGVPVTSFVAKKGSPLLLALVALIPTALIVGIVAYGIYKINDISASLTNLLVPVLLVIFGGTIIVGALLRKPAENIATAYLQGGGGQKLLAETSPKSGKEVNAPSAGRDNYSGRYYKAGDRVVRVTQSMFAKPLPPFLNNVYVLPWAYREMCEKYGEKEKYLPATSKKGKPTRYDCTIDTWQERDRASVVVTDKRTDKVIAQWWDNDVHDMFEDGFFKGGMGGERQLGTEKPSSVFVNSVYDYLESIGTLDKGQKFLPAVEALPATKNWPETEPEVLYVDMGMPVYYDDAGYKVYKLSGWPGDPEPYQVSEMGYGHVASFATAQEAINDAQSRRPKEKGLLPETQRETKHWAATEPLYLPDTIRYDPYKFAKEVLSENLFTQQDMNLYSGKSGTNPEGVSDDVWSRAFQDMGGKFNRLGSMYLVGGSLPLPEEYLTGLFDNLRAVDIEESVFELNNNPELQEEGELPDPSRFAKLKGKTQKSAYLLRWITDHPNSIASRELVDILEQKLNEQMEGTGLGPQDLLSDTKATGFFRIRRANIHQVKVTRSDMKGEFYVDFGYGETLPQGPEPCAPMSLGSVLVGVFGLNGKEVQDIMSRDTVVIFDAEQRAAHLWDMWNDLQAGEFNAQTKPVKFVLITTQGDTKLFNHAIVPKEQVEKANEKMKQSGLRPAQYSEAPEGAMTDEFGGHWKPPIFLPESQHAPGYELLENAKKLHKQALAYDKIPEGASFVIFSKDNPYAAPFNEAMLKLMRYHELRTGKFQPDTEPLSGDEKELREKIMRFMDMLNHTMKNSTLPNILKSIMEEQKASNDYHERGEQAKFKGDGATEALYKHIAGEEDMHAKEFSKRADEISKNGMNFMADSPEFLAQTIEDAGWKDKLAQAFTRRIEIAKGRK